MKTWLIISTVIGLLLPLFSVKANVEPLIDLRAEAKKYGEAVEEKNRNLLNTSQSLPQNQSPSIKRSKKKSVKPIPSQSIHPIGRILAKQGRNIGENYQANSACVKQVKTSRRLI